MEREDPIAKARRALEMAARRFAGAELIFGDSTLTESSALRAAAFAYVEAVKANEALARAEAMERAKERF